ncbi:dihydroorotate dehydrogenase [bacterium SM23_31]|nr:MAG: dihydroorotate dehydrogenase [bacterium SM23_31]
MDLSTKYMGFDLKNPIVPSSSPLMQDIDKVRRMEDDGAAAVVMDSLFEEQIKFEEAELYYFLEHGTESFAESLTYFPSGDDFYSGPELYLERIQKLKEAVSIPVIASMNGTDAEEWIKYAKLIEEAGADAIELNVYFLETGFNIAPGEVEKRYIEILKAVKSGVKIPVAVKLSPYFSAMASTAKELSDAGANALVLFNRFYQPDIDLANLEVVPNLVLSNSDEMCLPLRWIAIIYGNIKSSIAITSGVHTHEDIVKAIMAGADAVQMTSVLLQEGIDKIKSFLEELVRWMEEHEYESVDIMKGSLSQKACPDPAAFERANYMKTLRSYK